MDLKLDDAPQTLKDATALGEELMSYLKQNKPEFVATPNPYLSPECSMWANWERGKRIAKQLTSQEKVVMVYHGTHSDFNINGICRKGFDPSRRRCQLFGSGEYFSSSIETALTFSAGTRAVVVSLALICPQTKFRKGFSTVFVDNPPLAREIAFCLPILVVYDNSPRLESSAIRPHPRPTERPHDSASPARWSARHCASGWWWMPEPCQICELIATFEDKDLLGTSDGSLALSDYSKQHAQQKEPLAT